VELGVGTRVPRRPKSLRAILKKQLLCDCLGLVTVMLHMRLCRFGRMVIRMVRMSGGCVRVMRSSFMIPRLVMFRGGAVVLCRAFEMLCCLVVVLGCLFRHISS
jgi:hypothetical protein